jgi:uncharacterized membrane protein
MPFLDVNVMRRLFFPILFLFASCTLPAEKKARAEKEATATDTLHVMDTNLASRDAPPPPVIEAPKPVKLPSGIYRGILPVNGRIVQVIAFNSDRTFRLQEEYAGKDSIVITEGTWTPSDGFIWLYKDQVARGRYRWMGNTLAYFSPSLKKSFSMEQVKEAGDNPAWTKKKELGVQFFGTGTEPFWSIELKKDSLSFQLADWEKPLQMKLAAVHHTADSNSFEAGSDSTQLRLVVYPYFCSDGMSDLIYNNRIKVHYKGQVYRGCGVKMH